MWLVLRIQYLQVKRSLHVLIKNRSDIKREGKYAHARIPYPGTSKRRNACWASHKVTIIIVRFRLKLDWFMKIHSTIFQFLHGYGRTNLY